jgi:hypothetical protein
VEVRLLHQLQNQEKEKKMDKDELIKKGNQLASENFERLMKEKEDNPDEDPSTFKYRNNIKR